MITALFFAWLIFDVIFALAIGMAAHNEELP